MKKSQSGEEDYRKTLIQYWMEKARESMESAESDYKALRLSTAVRNMYYACFYALGAVLWKQGKSFKKHSGVRAAIHRELIKPGIIDVAWGEFYDLIFERRHKSDYEPLVSFTPDQVKELLEKSQGFISQIETLLAR